MKTIRLASGLGAVAVATALAGCAAVYDKPGATDAQRRRDEIACTRASMDRIPGGLMGDVQVSVTRIDRACMEARGYRLR